MPRTGPTYFIDRPVPQGTSGRRRPSDAVGDLAAGKVAVPDDPQAQQDLVKDGLGLKPPDARAEGAPVPATTPARPTAPVGAPLAAPHETRPARAFSEADVQAASSRVRSDQAVAASDWQASMSGHLQAALTNLLRQVDAAAGDPERLSAVAVPAELTGRWSAAIGDWLGQAWSAAAQTAEESGQTAPQAPTAALRARAALLSAHLAESARFEVVAAALRGDTLDQLAARYGNLVGTRLATDLTAAAKDLAGEIGNV